MNPRDVLARYQQAMLDKSADDLADLYADDAVHEFPFRFPGLPGRFEGREAVRAGYRQLWGATAVRARSVREVAVHETTDPQVIIAEQVVLAGPDGAEHAQVPGLLVIRVRDGRIVHVRDYMDAASVADLQKI
ncbi:nuclear transport factor 2 family protein [Streptomyces litchfieldiae]|uniref:Nuclear transport factor 2 family protein n=1 Tax=Streptomyces litchfieldiae TaxID=3075543 RepID=A0ABU2MIZ5_9ACTN|nr:nuclear transport factor 2 family protein [Streptomyces sp. DSM 44938]MDT0341570.1 nuclear transport factor 2 family protein [Streptomyces sp. DSM 44938]